MLIFDQLKKNDAQMRLLTVVVLSGFLVLFCGLWYVQIMSSKRFKASEKAQSFRTVRIPAQRGLILDRNGLPLAENKPNFSVNLYLKDLRKSFQETYSAGIKREEKELGKKLTYKEKQKRAPELRYQVVSNYLAQISPLLRTNVFLGYKKFNDHFIKQPSLPLSVMGNLEADQVARFLENPQRPPGIDLEIQPHRFYPNGTVAAHLLGHLRYDVSPESENEINYSFRLPDFRGAVGIEARYDEELRGTPGNKSVLINSLGYSQSETLFPQPEPGQDLVLTIDLPIQKAAEKALQTVGAKVQGAVVVMDAKNGDLYAVVSSPAYDPNAFVGRVSQELWDSLNDPEMLAMINRASYAIYAPGSIFKIITGLACMEAGTLDPNKFIRTEANFYIGKRPWKDLATPGDYDFVRAFKKSSNYYFQEHADRKGGIQKIIEIGKKLHLGEKISVFPGQEASGDFPTMEEVSKAWHRGETANIAIGQGRVSVTPMQMAVMTAAVANGGKVFVPRVVQKIIPSENSQESIQFPPAKIRDTLPVNPRNLQIVRKAMLADVEDREDEGTGRQAYVEGMRICGKTGTAQVQKSGRIVDHITWFVSFAPYEDPKYVVVVMVESGGSGGGTCAPVARQIYQAIKDRETKNKPAKGALVLNP